MIYNYTKCESVIAKVMADLDSTEVRNKTTDIREWIFEAVDKIGAPMLYISNEETFLIHDHQIPLPSGIQYMDAVAYSRKEDGPWVRMKSSVGSFKESMLGHHKKNNHFPQHKLMTSQSQLYTVNGLKYLEQDIANEKFNKPEYFIKPGWLVTNKKDGFVKIAYKTIATDERGYPLIPDLSSYQEAVYWYVVMKLSFPGFLKGKLGGKGVNTPANTYFYLQQQWNFYRNQAYAEAMMPTSDELQNIKDDWHRLIPDWNADERFFNDINKEELIYNDYHYGY